MSKQPQEKKTISKTNKTIIVKPKEKKQAISIKEEKIINNKKQIPEAIIIRPLKHKTINRKGDGFSRSELHSINITPKKARQLGLKVDIRRKTEWKINIESLKNWLKVTKKSDKITQKIKTIPKVMNKEK